MANSEILIRVYTVCKGLPVPIFRVITVLELLTCDSSEYLKYRAISSQLPPLERHKTGYCIEVVQIVLWEESGSYRKVAVVQR